jgi:acyl-CoA synthetase (AMP-forming)/AMP-acid ligase II
VEAGAKPGCTMLYGCLNHPESAQATAVIDATGPTSWRELKGLSDDYRTDHRELSGTRVGLLVTPAASAIAMMAALEELRAHLFLLDADLTPDRAARIAARFELSATLAPGPNPTQWIPQAYDLSTTTAIDRGVTILTSGTEGQPKAATHTWESLSRPVRKNTSPQNWLLAYRLNLYAGIQVMLQALLNHGTLIVPETGASAADVVRMLRVHGAQYASATPSFWRRLLLFADRAEFREVPLSQITLGGEPVDQPILDELGKLFPHARITHIFATTELGRCFSVLDGQAGFPKSFLHEAAPGNAELRVEDGQLFVRSPNRMCGYELAANKETVSEMVSPPDTAGWLPTGDLVQIEGDRVHFVGRLNELINVGGNKVRPIVVERFIRAIAGVADVRVYATSSSVAGQLVACDVVPAAGVSGAALQATINKECRRKLANYQIPRVINLVAEISTSAAGKVIRSEDAHAQGSRDQAN